MLDIYYEHTLSSGRLSLRLNVVQKEPSFLENVIRWNLCLGKLAIVTQVQRMLMQLLRVQYLRWAFS
jgi:hypothetical protein